MRFSHQLFLLAFLATLFRPNDGSELPTKPNDITGGVKDLLMRERDKLTNASDIIGQIMSLLNCGPFPLSPNSHLQYSWDYVTKNPRLFQACDRYFRTTKQLEFLQVECKYKKWIFNEIGCEKTTCPRLAAPPGGHISTSDNTYNTTVYFWCSRGFSINGTATLFCEGSGLWNLEPPTCDVSYCHALPAPRHGFVSSGEETATNQTVEFSCKSEYSLIGDAVLRCQDNGRWNTIAPVCKKVCIVPNITSQSEGVRSVPELKQLSIGSLLQLGQRVIFSCKPGYTMLSSGPSTCIGGTWRPPIRCRKMCAALKITNGIYALSKDSSTIQYGCVSGYRLVGQRKLSCTPNITWDSEPPTCTKMCGLNKRPNVLTFRRKETYEKIPFGTHIVNGTQVYSICRDGTWKTAITECVDGVLRPYPCVDPRSRVQGGFLKILYGGNKWRRICEMTDDACAAFGFITTYSGYCERCHDLNLNTYLATSNISFGRMKYRKFCIKCT